MNEKGMLEKVQQLEKELRAVKGVTGVEFDLNAFYDHPNKVIIKIEWKKPKEKLYWEKRRQLISGVIRVAKENGLSKTSSTEDYGDFFYFHFQPDKSWEE